MVRALSATAWSFHRKPRSKPRFSFVLGPGQYHISRPLIEFFSSSELVSIEKDLWDGKSSKLQLPDTGTTVEVGVDRTEGEYRWTQMSEVQPAPLAIFQQMRLSAHCPSTRARPCGENGFLRGFTSVGCALPSSIKFLWYDFCSGRRNAAIQADPNQRQQKLRTGKCLEA